MMRNTNGGPEVKLFSKLDKIVFSALGIVVLAAVSWKILDVTTGKKEKAETTKEKKKPGEKKEEVKTKAAIAATQVKIINKWDMPPELKEISALCYMDENRFLSVQDELGAVFIYNINSKEIEKKIPFAGKGDFEGVALKEKTAYVMRADGRIFEVDIEQPGKGAKELKTSLTAKQNVEGLCYDKDNDRLLLAIKDREPGSDDYKGIYAFNLKDRTFVEEPVIKIDLRDPAFEDGKKKSVMPSSITIHPVSKDIYITDGPKSKLLILDQSGKVKNFLSLGKAFSQPEGITFSPKGEMFISNEGTKQPGNIIQLEITTE